ncbi:TIGR03086 family protein [Streptomyces spiroverticillatus]|uniref:TIGR03086 family protein n=1 Tax=Streptomyces finlayi TaxID=67296 RepID=A0A918WXI5_9ACTN|nr:TIGR03086 family metal-binding protein [Streptomyces finlayi]GGZ91516.1 TIGR03086 family protein [Streptomyces spiroverticillatus]GHC93748.1 TIGR03086 family protein [Streptomyces finlayi]
MTTTTTAAPTAVVFDLGPAARRLARLLDGVAEGGLDGPTPCAEFSVRDLLAHLVHLTAAFRAAARKEPEPPAGPALPADWRHRLPGQLAALVDSWHEKDAWTGSTTVGGTPLPAGVAAQIALDELVLHGWDLARATGRPFACDRSSLQVVYALLAPEADNPARAPMFGPVVDVPDGSPFLDRVVGLGGRDPQWVPAADEFTTQYT